MGADGAHSRGVHNGGWIPAVATKAGRRDHRLEPRMTTTLVVIIHSSQGERDWRAGGSALVDAICADDAVVSCASSVIDLSIAPDTAPFLAFATATMPEERLETVAGKVAPVLDPAVSSLLEAQERKVITYERSWDVGSETPGERVVTVVERKAPMTRDEFDQYWRDVHTDVALSYTVAPWAYHQYLTLRSLLAGGVEPDGALIMHFRSAEERRSRYEDHPDDAARGAVDAAAFMDLERTRMVLMRETIHR